MLEEIKGNNGKILLAAMAGTTAGIIVGLLMAPQRGQDARRNLVQRAFNVGDIVNNAFKKYAAKQKPKKAGKKKRKKTESAD